MKKLPSILLACCVAFSSLSLVACASSDTAPQESFGQSIKDGATTAKIKAVIFNTPALESAVIQVSTQLNQVQLSGTVTSKEQSQIAQQIATNIVGPKNVTNNLVLQGTSTLANS